MQKNVSGQNWIIFAFNITTGLPKTGDSANITAKISLDGGALASTATPNPTELGGGYYFFPLAQGETNGALILIAPSSVTANIQVIGVPGAIWAEPAGQKYPSTLATADVSGNLPAEVKVQDNIDFGALQKLSLNAATPSVTVSDKTGFSLSATGADLILKSSTFIQAIVAAINEFTVDGLIALNTLIVAIKTVTDKFAFTVPNQVDANALTGGGGLNAAGVRAALGMAAANFDTQLGGIPSAVWTYATRTLSSFGTLISDTVTAVWSTVLSVFTTPGTAGKALSSAASAGDPWETLLPGTYGNGMAGQLIGNLPIDLANIPTELSNEHGNGVWGGSSVILPVMRGAVYTATAQQHQTIRLMRGDTPRIYFSLGANYAGWVANFAAKISPNDIDYAMSIRNCIWTDATTGAGYFDLTAMDTETVERYYGEIQLSSSGQVLTVMEFMIVIIQDIITD